MSLIPKPYFADIETVRATDKFPEGTQLGYLFLKYFNYKLKKMIDEYDQPTETLLEITERLTQTLWENEAGLMAEFGKICCVSLGKVIKREKTELYIKTYAGSNEQKLLTEVAKKLDSFEKDDRLCAHNGNEFDFPYMRRRMIINRIRVPLVLNTLAVDKKWDLRLDDSLDMWSGTQWKHRASLPLLCEAFGIESSKTEMDGSMVGEVYYKIMRHELPFDHDAQIMETIGKYCPGDIVALVKVYCLMKGLDFPEEIIYAS
jgi:predicted PolB exonuclease-like 3'-5' exonuclease